MPSDRWKVMIVDDSQAVRRAVSLMLDGGPYDCLEAEDGQAALEVLAEVQVDCVISDLHMPRMNGLELLRQVRRLPTHRFVPFLVLTTDRVDENRDDLRKAGATGIFSKPIEPEDLARAVGRALAGAG